MADNRQADGPSKRGLFQLPFTQQPSVPSTSTSADSTFATNFGADGVKPFVRKVRVHKIKSSSGSGSEIADEKRNAGIDRRIAELIPGLADVSVSEQAMEGSVNAARDIRLRKQAREEQMKADTKELQQIYDFSKSNPVDKVPEDHDPATWQQALRPKPRKVELSSYQAEMINYQRMLLRKNIWYYRDRMSVPRGPCPLHVLKDSWVQGVIDENTLVWGNGLYDWLPAKNVKLLLPMIRTPEGAQPLRLALLLLSGFDESCQ